MNAEQERLGTVMRNMREDDRVFIELDGERIGEVFVARVPHDAKVRVAFRFAKRFRISHGDKPEVKP